MGWLRNFDREAEAQRQKAIEAPALAHFPGFCWGAASTFGFPSLFIAEVLSVMERNLENQVPDCHGLQSVGVHFRT